eukprot:3108774-Amphidinium_carterae.1
MASFVIVVLYGNSLQLHLFKGEAARRLGQSTATVFIDMSKCYESVLHLKILQGAQRYGVQHWAAANCKLYQAGRRIRWGDFTT